MGNWCSASPSDEGERNLNSLEVSTIFELPLHKACRQGDLASVKVLLSSNDSSDINALNGASQTPLIEACRAGEGQTAIYLIDTFDELNTLLVDDSGRQAITYAAGRGMKEVVLKLLSCEGADVNGGARNGEGTTSTPLWHAACEGHAEVVKFLLRQEGVDVNATDGNHWSALFQATRMGHVDVAEMLLSKGADPSLAGLPDLENPLHIAAVNGTANQIRIADMLIRSAAAAGEDTDYINITNRLGYTALIVAAIKGHTHLVRLLVQHGADPNIRMPGGETASLSALHLACIKDHGEIASLLLGAGAAINYQDEDGMTAMNYAEEKGHVDCMLSLEAHRTSRF
jgi:ankyrin repeat protein